MKKTIASITLLVGLTASATPAAAGPDKVHAEALEDTSSLDGSQLLAADGDGRIYLLAGQTLAVYPVTRHGALGDPEALRPLAGASDAIVAVAAALSKSGDTWLVQSFLGSSPVRMFRAGKEVQIPRPSWSVTAVAWAGSDAVIATGSRRPGGETAAAEPTDTPAALVLEEHQWEPLLDAEPEDLTQDVDPFRLRRAQEEVHLTPGRERRLWWAAKNRYWIREISPTGKVLTEITVGDRQVELRERNDHELAQLAAARESAAEQGYTIPQDLAATPVARTIIDGIALGRDGHLYVLLPPAKGEGAGSRLDRYDATRGALERVELDLPGYTGKRTFVAGADGLYVANFKAGSGWWRIPWETLEEAPWKRVEESRIE